VVFLLRRHLSPQKQNLKNSHPRSLFSVHNPQALALHPDKQGGSLDAFMRVQRAWEARLPRTQSSPNPKLIFSLTKI
jgi:hypothetical protein